MKANALHVIAMMAILLISGCDAATERPAAPADAEARPLQKRIVGRWKTGDPPLYEFIREFHEDGTLTAWSKSPGQPELKETARYRLVGDELVMINQNGRISTEPCVDHSTIIHYTTIVEAISDDEMTLTFITRRRLSPEHIRILAEARDESPPGPDLMKEDVEKSKSVWQRIKGI